MRRARRARSLLRLSGRCAAVSVWPQLRGADDPRWPGDAQSGRHAIATRL